MAKEEKIPAKETKPAPRESKKEDKSVTRKQQPNFFERAVAGIRRFIAETVGELRKVSWPTRKEATYLTVIVLVVTGIMSVILGAFDWVFSKLFEFILTLPV